ncbi:hypothetical protein SDC9_179469 [bioreactor metagenome]|uniref:Uncharacterized protein n=1 Tax=bioreactor metagenome TaxID=1076179 RepID=A0A645H6T8_9ZZZZ
MTPDADERASAGFVPLAGDGGRRAFEAFLPFHEEDPAFLRADDLRGLQDIRGVHIVFGVHEKPVAFGERVPHRRDVVEDPLIHPGFRHGVADRGDVAGRTEISGQRLFAEDVFSGRDGFNGDSGVQERRGAYIDHVDFGIS